MNRASSWINDGGVFAQELKNLAQQFASGQQPPIPATWLDPPPMPATYPKEAG